jgi:hypothetical protein
MTAARVASTVALLALPLRAQTPTRFVARAAIH